MPAKQIHLAPAAAGDLRDIQRYTVAQWGHAQWLHYIDGLDSVFEQLSDSPELGSARDEVRPGLRSFPVRSHVVWYRIQADRLQIVRLLHGAMDPDSRL